MQETSEGAVAEYAGFWIRFGAYLIDGIVLSIVTWVFSLIFGLGFWGIFRGELNGNEVLGGALGLFFVLLSFLIGVAYFVGFWAWRGQTPGKMAVGIKIIRTDGSDITWGTALLRYLGYILSAVILYIGFIWIGFDKRKQGIHDKLAETYVVKLPRLRPVLPETRG